MASLKHRATGDLHDISSRCVAGRSPHSSLRLSSRLASSTHAEILWNGSCWELRDLGSRNGTFVGARRLEPGERVLIRRGTQLAFGDAEDLFELVEDGPPSVMAVSDDGQRQAPEDGLLVLPEPDRPVLTIFDEGGGVWVAESNEGERRRIAHGDTLSTDTRRWRIELPLVPEHTVQPGAERLMLRRLTMRFSVSRDEEHIKITLIQDNKVKALRPRAHHYMLLTLARARLDDQQSGDISEDESGWMYVSELLDMLRLDEPALNVGVCRARKELARAEVHGAAELIERHSSTRRLRLGVQNIEIMTI